MLSEHTNPLVKAHPHRWRAAAVRAAALVLALVAIVVPPESLRGTIVTLLIIGGLGLMVWRLPMSDSDNES
ncbi:MAG TPA: hypothetical protein VFU88_00960 [Ktedonobacterales bacterium]|nr:hypothetical protein [Ktedonobacterales bacterium]